jgi:hypothetical protein
MTDKEALKLTLEALKIARDQIVDPEYGPIGWDVSRLDEVLSIGKQALAAPVQDEDVAAFEAALQKEFQRDYAIVGAARPTLLTFNSGNAEWVMRITADRRIEVNEGVEVTEAAQKVLDALQHRIKPAQPEQERNFCPRCGKRTADLTVIHTCTPPQKNT